MSNNLAAGQTLALLESLKGTVEELAARSEKLNQQAEQQAAKEKQRFESALEEHNQQTNAAISEAEASFQAAITAAEQHYQTRKTRIGRAFQTSKALGLKKVEDQVGARKYELQKKMLQAERDRETGLTTTARNFEELRRNLADEEQRLRQLEQTVLKAFSGYSRFGRLFRRAYEKVDVDLSADANQMLLELRERLARVGTELSRFQSYFLLRLFKYWPVWLILALAGGGFLVQQFGLNNRGYRFAGAEIVASLFVIWVMRWYAQRRTGPFAASISKGLAQGRRFLDAAQEKGATHHQQELQRIQQEYQTAAQTADHDLKQTLAKAGESRVACRMSADERTVKINARSEELYRARLKRLDRDKTENLKELQNSAELRVKALTDERDAKLQLFASEHQAGWSSLEREWNERLRPAFQELETLRITADELFPPWSAPALKNWSPPKKFAQAARFANLRVDLGRFSDQMPKDKRLVLPGPSSFELPLCVAYPEQGSLLIETAANGHDVAIGALNNVILRLLSVAPPGRLNFTVLDPVGLGQNFAGVMHLADYEEQIINSRIWTQSTQIEQKLADLNEHMEKVIQMYLRNEYQTIAEYNEQAGVIAEKYYFLVVADFPANFTETAAKRLLSIAASGARCGVYMLIHWDRRLPLPQEFIPDEPRKACVCVNLNEKEAVLPGRTRAGAALALDEPPSPEVATEFVNTVGKFSRDSSRVEVPFDQIIPAPEEIWTEDTSLELRVPIGRTGATKLQYLAIGKGTRQHGLVAGKTGSGKSTLFHVIITNLALWCSPEQVEFYLVDFKKGVEFKCYGTRRLPHARVVAIESDREFGLSVLQRVGDELGRRGDLFRQLGVQDLAGYKRAGGTEALPRTLLLIDEFQEFFVEDDKVAQNASLLLDRIVRQGRAFGIHVLLGSQTLGGAYTVARTTLGQMVIRIALQCNEADAYLIMDDTNPAPRLLSRPGEGIYNDMAGALEGNSPFQVVWLPEEVRDNWLTKVRERADSNGEVYPGPIVFEGNAPADVRENTLLRAALAGKIARPPVAARLWLGAPNSIKGPTEAVFHRQSGNNLLIVGQREETVLGLFSIGLITLAAQYPPGAARFIFLDATPPGTAAREYLEQVARIIPHSLTLAKQGDLPGLMQELAQEMKRRTEDVNAESAPPVFLFIHGLQRFGKLRFEEDFGFTSGDAEAAPNPAAILNNLVCEGTRLGFHVVASCDTYNNVARFLSRKALSEFEMRVLFQMSINDSASLIDNPKAGLLGLHRALFYNAQEGYLETFRPYALPGRDWLEEAGRALAVLQGQQVAKTETA